MNAFEKLIADFSSKTGLGLVPDERQGCLLETEGIIITIQYRQGEDDIVIFAPVTDPDSGVALTKTMCEKALSLSYNGKGTNGATLGLFDGNLILSVHLPMQGLNAEALGDKLMTFADAAVSTRAEIAAAANASEAESGNAGQDDALEDFIRV